MLLGEIERDCERFPQNEPLVVDRGQPAVGIEGEVVGLPGAGSTDLDRNVLVVETKLVRDP